MQMNTHDCVVFTVRLPFCASVCQKQRSSCEEPGRFLQRCPSPVSHPPASAIKVHQSSALAALYLWQYAAPRRLAHSCPPPSFPPFAPQGICHSPVISFINSWFPPAFLHRPCRRREGNHRSENGDHFVPVPGLAAVGMTHQGGVE